MEIFQIIVPIITLIIGLLLGHKLSLGRDKRKEFNDIATPIYIKLEKQLERANSDLYPVIDSNEISQVEITKLKRASNSSNAQEIQITYDKYISALAKSIHKPKDFKYGDKLKINLEEVKPLITKLQRFLQVK